LARCSTINYKVGNKISNYKSASNIISIDNLQKGLRYILEIDDHEPIICFQTIQALIFGGIAAAHPGRRPPVLHFLPLLSLILINREHNFQCRILQTHDDYFMSEVEVRVGYENRLIASEKEDSRRCPAVLERRHTIYINLQGTDTGLNAIDEYF
jgi:hypothetical protein